MISFRPSYLCVSQSKVHEIKRIGLIDKFGELEMENHPGIRIDKIPVAGVAGLFFAVGLIMIGFMGLPTYRWWFLIAVSGGVIGGVILYLWNNR